MFTLWFVAFYFVLGLNFIFSFISHLSCIIIIVYTFISYPLFSLTPLSISGKKEEIILESILENIVISIMVFKTGSFNEPLNKEVQGFEGRTEVELWSIFDDIKLNILFIKIP